MNNQSKTSEQEQDTKPAAFKIQVDESHLNLTEPEPTGRMILEHVGKDPRTHFLVQIIPGKDDVVVDSDDNVDLRLSGVERFAVVSRSKQYPIHIDEGRFVVTDYDPDGLSLLELAGKAPCRYALIQVIPNGDDQFIDPSERVDLRRPGLERFITALKDEVTIFIEHDHQSLSIDMARGDSSAANIKTIAGVPDGYVLYQQKDGPPLPVADGAIINIEGCETFLTQVKGGGSS